MAKGYYLGVGDETTCGGVIIEGDATHVLMGKAVAHEQDRVTCGKHPGTYIIIGHVPGDSVNGRKFAGTLNSQSNCPCKAWFIPSLVHDTYEFGARSKSQNMSEISTEVEREMVENVSESEEKSKVVCAHIDGALVVASYILDEIKKNVKSDTADKIRSFIDNDLYKKRLKEWQDSPWYARMNAPPQPEIISASVLWFMAVKSGAKWDHKPKIRDQFKAYAVSRPLVGSGTLSKSYFHKYEEHDYFYDVWSNIHYGYVGLSLGFDESYLLLGSTLEQVRTSIGSKPDPIDDITCMKIGYALYHQHGKYAETLDVRHILDALESASDLDLAISRQIHWCWNNDNSSQIDHPQGK
ncbi:polymorphic toxin type 44 domain-containing protein [Yersinia pseudotuberculosis]|uniref:polymorphic toxin type 44 domain-containing protein n=1 Tax=Yersinia pseudotuberculosis TaxID=633 RepID=UPI001A9FA9BB|nr:polymorphic toxin type 44 domain-containing protein [Yersinia pseudotuberculosis]